jgi:hypothetical protein
MSHWQGRLDRWADGGVMRAGRAGRRRGVRQQQYHVLDAASGFARVCVCVGGGAGVKGVEG